MIDDEGNKQLLKEYDFDEADQDSRGNVELFPKPLKKHRIIFEAYNQNIEELYYWILNHLRDDWLYNVDKVKDIFASSEASSFFGVTAQRTSLQQDQVSKYLASIGKMTKDLFQIVREMRIIDERVSYYNDTYQNNEKAESSEIVLKGIWVDMVEGGSKNPSSVYGLAKEVGFTILPDLFFRVIVKQDQILDKEIDRLDFNPKVKEVLKRKLRQFYEWKKRTYAELNSRRLFTLKYLRQHYDTIKLYIDWVKPYLRQIRRLQGRDKTDDEDLIGAFEGALVEIEILAYKKKGFEKAKYKPVIIASWDYRAKPSMTYQQDYQRGPSHVGRTVINLRAYSWTQEQIDKFKDMRAAEDLKVISSIDESLKAAIDSLGDELKKYLIEAGEVFSKEKKKSSAKKEGGLLEPFTSIFYGFTEIFGSLGKWGKPAKKGEAKLPGPIEKGQEKVAGKTAKDNMFTVYKNFKKAHKFFAW